MKGDFSTTPPHIKFRCGDFLMKNRISQKINFIKIFLPICAVALLSACDLLEESPKDFLEDYGSVAGVAKTEFSGETVSQGQWQNIGSSDDVTIKYSIENPGNHRLHAAVTFPDRVAPYVNIVFPENDDLLQATETGTNFLRTTFNITFLQSFLAGIDGDVSKFDISPTVLLYRADFGAEERPQSSHTIRLQCNTPPEEISNAMGEKIVEADGSEKLVLVIELPALKMDDKYLTVEENGRKHVFDLPISDGAKSSDGLWTISSAAPAGIEAATYDENGKPITPADRGWIPNCYIITDIDIKELAPFDIALTLTDEGGLISRHSFTSHGRKLDMPYPTSATTLEQDESDGMAAFTLQATDGATIHYTVTQTSPVGGAYSDLGSGTTPLEIKLPAGTFTIEAHAEKEGFARSDDFTESVTVNPSVFFVRAEGDDASGNGSKSAPFATIKKAVDSFMSFTPAPTSAKIFILSDLTISDATDKTIINLSGTDLLLQGCDDGNAGSRVTVSCAFSNAEMFVINSGNVTMQDLVITQTSSSITQGILVDNGAHLGLKNVSISGMKTTTGAVNVHGKLNILGGVQITGNTNSTSGGALNLWLPSRRIINVTKGSLSGTSIGVSTETAPTQSAPVIITSGYGSNYGVDIPSTFTSDKGYAFNVNAGEVELVASGGTIIVPPIQSIQFSFDRTNIKIEESGNGSAITIYAFDGNGDPIDVANFTNWSWQLYQGSVFAGKKGESNKIENILSDSKFPSNTTYVIKVTATYGGIQYSGDLHYKKT